MAKLGAHVQECGRRPRSRDESANDDEVPWVRIRVNHRVVRGKLIALFGEVCLQGSSSILYRRSRRVPVYQIPAVYGVTL